MQASENLLRDAIKFDDLRLVTTEVKGADDPSAMSKMLTNHSEVVAIVGAVDGKNLRLFVSRSSDVDLDCRTLLTEMMKITGGGGGGKKEFAQGGGGDPSKLPEAFRKAPDILRTLLKGSG